ncbi:hypothetical protein Rhe02_26800 [Rhizocola hellebori]|uniref:Uncharacterized protein n=1 Tax=Rhizocola hellebori TaxID=1392758 RepID=A0A8J3Q7C4_9ACTN|nr:hypothetical protein Rhe02_26800 [Rhizocola hellebori]
MGAEQRSGEHTPLSGLPAIGTAVPLFVTDKANEIRCPAYSARPRCGSAATRYGSATRSAATRRTIQSSAATRRTVRGRAGAVPAVPVAMGAISAWAQQAHCGEADRTLDV